MHARAGTEPVPTAARNANGPATGEPGESV